MSFIPSSRRVIGRDLKTIKQQFGITTADACFLFGVSITKWTQLVSNKPDEPIKEPTLSLLIRLLAEYPDLSVIPKMPTTEEMFQLFESIGPVDQKRFSLLLGSEASAGNRWRRNGSRPSQTLERLMYYLRLALLSRSQAERLTLMESWKQTIVDEAVARGVTDILRSGQWKPRSEIIKSKQSLGAVAAKKRSIDKRTKAVAKSQPNKTSLRKGSASKRISK